MAETPAENSAPVPAKKPRGRPFAKGQSGNPGGKPKDAKEVRDVLALKGKELAEKLLKLALEEDNAFALKTALEYVLGKPAQSLDVTSEGKALAVSITINRGGGK